MEWLLKSYGRAHIRLNMFLHTSSSARKPARFSPSHPPPSNDVPCYFTGVEVVLEEERNFFTWLDLFWFNEIHEEHAWISIDFHCRGLVVLSMEQRQGCGVRKTLITFYRNEWTGKAYVMVADIKLNGEAFSSDWGWRRLDIGTRWNVNSIPGKKILVGT